MSFKICQIQMLSLNHSKPYLSRLNTPTRTINAGLDIFRKQRFRQSPDETICLNLESPPKLSELKLMADYRTREFGIEQDLQGNEHLFFAGPVKANHVKMTERDPLRFLRIHSHPHSKPSLFPTTNDVDENSRLQAVVTQGGISFGQCLTGDWRSWEERPADFFGLAHRHYQLLANPRQTFPWPGTDYDTIDLKELSQSLIRAGCPSISFVVNRYAELDRHYKIWFFRWSDLEPVFGVSMEAELPQLIRIISDNLFGDSNIRPVDDSQLINMEWQRQVRRCQHLINYGEFPEVLFRTCMQIVQECSKTIGTDEEPFTNLRQVYLYALSHHGGALRYADARFRDDPEVAKAAISDYWGAFSYASKRLQNDPDFVKFAVRATATNPCGYMSYSKAGEAARENKEVVLEFLRGWGSIKDVDPSLQLDRDVLLMALKKHQEEEVAKLIPPGSMSDRKIMMRLVKSNGTWLEKAAAILTDDPKIVQVAITEYPESLKFASQRLKSDFSFITRCVRLRFIKKVFPFIDDSIKPAVRAWYYDRGYRRTYGELPA